MKLLLLFVFLESVLATCPSSPTLAMDAGMELTDCVGSVLAHYFIENDCCVRSKNATVFQSCSKIGAAAYLRDIKLNEYCEYINKDSL